MRSVNVRDRQLLRKLYPRRCLAFSAIVRKKVRVSDSRFSGKWLVLIFVSIAFAAGLIADNITAILDSDDGSSAFAFRDSGSALVASIDSDGNIQAKGGMRLDSGGAECATAEMLIVDGRVGINTANPSQELEIGGTRPMSFDSGSGNVRVKGNNAGWAYSYGALGYSGTDHGGYGIYGSSDSLVYYWIGDVYNSPDMVVRSGKVGIGNTNPSSTLTVTGTGAFSQTLEVSGPFKLNHGEGLEFHSDMSYFGGSADGRVIRMIDLNGTLGNVDGGIAFERYTPTDGVTEEVMALRGNGRVGIGTNKPVEKLDVDGAIKIGAAAGTNNGTIRWTGTDFEGRKGGSWTSLTGGGGGVELYASSGTFTVPDGVDTLYVEVWGGGGGGLCENSGSGGNGGTSSFGAYLSASGGAGATGTGTTPYAGAGGSGANGDINLTGGYGEDTGYHVNSGGGAPLGGAGGAGGDWAFANSRGRDGVIPGGGGGGAHVSGVSYGAGGGGGGYSFEKLTGLSGDIAVTVGAGGAADNAARCGAGAPGLVRITW